jgi:Uma2 family endonuclease
MATATIASTQIANGDQCVELHDVDWKGYTALLRIRGDRSMPKIVYLDGTVWVMSPSFPHERLKNRLGWLVQVIVEELDIPCIPAASTTFRQRRKRGGVEGDQTYYLANEALIRGQKQIRLKSDPPPDLAIEAVSSHDAEAAVEVYRRIKVPEVWACDESELTILVRRPNGRYVRSASSAAFPFLLGSELHEWVTRPQTDSETTWVKAFRIWVRDTLVPRRAAAGSNPATTDPQQTGRGHRKES